MQGNGNGIAELQVVFRDRPDLIFRHFPESTVAMMRWQCGRNVTDVGDLPNGYGAFIERFELLAWASTREQLIAKLSC
jgi:hypothetical protein